MIHVSTINLTLQTWRNTMAVKLNASNLFADSNTVAPATTARNERPQAQVWANIGFRTTITGEDGEQKEVFIQLPYGIPVDTMNEIDVPRKEGNYKDMVSAQN